MNEETITITEYGFRHIGDWTIVPYIATGDNGWEFTWLCFIVARFTIDESGLDEDGDFSEYGDH